MNNYDKLVFEISRPGRVGYTLSDDEFSSNDYTKHFADNIYFYVLHLSV